MNENDKSKSISFGRVVLIIFAIIGAICAIAALGTVIVRYIKKKRNGYLFNFFDRDSYDIVSPEEEEKFDCIIRYELCDSDDDAPLERIAHHAIPVDEDETEESYK